MTARVTHRRPATGLVAVALAMALGGCAVAPSGPSVAVMPGTQKSLAQFQSDEGVCRQQAQTQVAPGVEAANNQAAASAVVGTVIGAAIGALAGYGSYGSYGNYANQAAAWGAGTGLVYGGTLGGGYSQSANYGLQQRYDAVFAQCMYLRGNQVPGAVSQRRAAPLPPPPPGYGAPAYPPRNALPPAVPPPNTPPPLGVIAPA